MPNYVLYSANGEYVSTVTSSAAVHYATDGPTQGLRIIPYATASNRLFVVNDGPTLGLRFSTT